MGGSCNPFRVDNPRDASSHWGKAALIASLLACGGAELTSFQGGRAVYGLGLLLAHASLVGLIAGLVGLRERPRWPAAIGLILGGFIALQLPTIYLPLVRSFQR
jgi:hypothetical protein